jgi:hypothetical protein
MEDGKLKIENWNRVSVTIVDNFRAGCHVLAPHGKSGHSNRFQSGGWACEAAIEAPANMPTRRVQAF